MPKKTYKKPLSEGEKRMEIFWKNFKYVHYGEL